MAKDFYYTICLFLCAVVLALRSPVFADCGQPHESTGTNTTDSGSQSTDSGSTGDSSIKTPAGDVGSTTGGQLGATFDPSAQGGGGQNPGLLTLQNKGFKPDPFMWRSYVKFIKEMSDLSKERKEAKMNEYIRRTSWENSSGLTDARQRYDEAQKKSNEAYSKYVDSSLKEKEAFSVKTRAEEHRDRLESYLQNERLPPERREEYKKELEEVQKNLKPLEENWRSAFQERNQALDKFEELNKVQMQRWDQEVRPALGRYKNMEAHYNNAIQAPIPQPSGSGR